MKLLIVRKPAPAFTLGDLYLDGTWQCFTLEDDDRRLEDGGVKLAGYTAIPLGLYDVVIDYSPKFKRQMLHVLNVPQFAGIRIHAGNDADDTEGCILVGEDVSASGDLIRSARALASLQTEVANAIARDEPVTLNVTRE